MEEPIWRLARALGVLILPDRAWWPSRGAWYALCSKGPSLILLPFVPAREERWLIAHELGHHMRAAHISGPPWLAEAKADRWAVKTLLRLYDVDQVAWPDRVRNLLPHWEDVAA